MRAGCVVPIRGTAHRCSRWPSARGSLLGRLRRLHAKARRQPHTRDASALRSIVLSSQCRGRRAPVCLRHGSLAQLRIRLHSVSWSAVARTFLGPESAGACHLNEVREVPPGTCEDVSASQCRRHQLWNPAAIASEPFRGEDAAGALRSAARACVQAWASEHSHVLVGLSGGLDSSVTLSCLADAPTHPRITAVTQFGEDRESDERVYARLMAHRAGCELIEVPRTTDADFRACEYSAVFESSPGLRLPTVDRIEPDRALQLGATAIFRGHGGDELFCRNQTSLYLIDFLLQRRTTTGLFDLLTHAANSEGVTVWSILARAFWTMLRPARLDVPTMISPDVRDSTLLHQDVLSDLIAHDSSSDSGELESHALPPGRRWQIHLLCARRNLSGPFDREKDPDVICPLLSQPLVELCLRIPTWLQMTDHTDRALTRAAFAGDLPAEILNRVEKGWRRTNGQRDSLHKPALPAGEVARWAGGASRHHRSAQARSLAEPRARIELRL